MVKYLKRGPWTVCIFRRGLGKKRGDDIFEGGLRRQCPLCVGGTFLLAQWLIGIKYPKQIILCDTNTVIVLIIVIIINT